MAERYRVERDFDSCYELSRLEAESLFVDLRTVGTPMVGLFPGAFEYTAVRRLDGVVLGRVRVRPVAREQVPAVELARLEQQQPAADG